MKIKKIQGLPTLSCVSSTLGREKDPRLDVATSFLVFDHGSESKLDDAITKLYLLSFDYNFIKVK